MSAQYNELYEDYLALRRNFKIALSLFLIGAFILVALMMTGFKGEANYKNKYDELEQSYQYSLDQVAYLQRENNTLREKLELAPKLKKHKPQLTLSPSQNKFCLALVIYGEETQGTLTDMTKIGQMAVNRAEQGRFGGTNVCAVAHFKDGITSAVYYKRQIEKAVWTGDTSYVPESTARKANLVAWKKSKQLASKIIDGETVWLTKANHSFAIKTLKNVKSWMRDMRVENYTSAHVLMTDEDLINGKLHRYTKEEPFNQANYTLAMATQH